MCDVVFAEILASGLNLTWAVAASQRLSMCAGDDVQYTTSPGTGRQWQMRWSPLHAVQILKAQPHSLGRWLDSERRLE